MTETFGAITTSLGAFGWVADGDVLLATYLPMRPVELTKRISADWPEAVARNRFSTAFTRAVIGYFEGRPATFGVDVRLSQFSPFHQAVLNACRGIAFGETMTYGALAAAAGRSGAARAVGNAMARNPAPLVIPCHRVLRSGGSLGGFSAPQGTRLKQAMLALEGILLPVAGETAA